jgi:pilus assembly protein Flp/PilA
MKLFSKLQKLKKSRSGATAIEYALIGGLICIAVVGGMMSIGTSTNGSFNAVSEGVWGSGS